MKHIARFIYFKILRWKLIGEFPKVDKAVVIIVPHTSWVDFVLAILIRSVINEQINFIGKKSLFNFPFGWFFRWMGGAPVDRSKNNDTVSAIAQIFNENKKFRLGLSPEGTRKKVTAFKTGFYYIAKTANVPIIMVAFDYGLKQIKISKAHFTTENKEADFKTYARYFKGVVGKIPENSF